MFRASHSSTRRGVRLTATVAGFALVGTMLSACAAPAAQGNEDGQETTGVGQNLEEIIDLAQQEGKVHLIAYPENWAGYGESFKAFTEKFGVEVEVSSPNASSAEELQAVETLKGDKTQPDVLDIGYSFTNPAKQKQLLDKFVPSVIDEVPDNLKDPEGYWVGAYYGVMSIGVNANLVDVPTKWTDLLDPQYKGKIYIGDPREGASQFAAVFASSLANGGDLDNIQPGIDFFEQLAEGGYLATATSATAGLITGEIAVALDWNYNFNGAREEVEASGVDLQVRVPSDGVFGNFYAQPVTVNSPQPNAGRLWIEWLLSDDGANIYAKYGAVPARITTMVKEGTLSKEAEAGLPDAKLLENIAFPTLEQGEAATALVVSQWGPKVANKR